MSSRSRKSALVLSLMVLVVVLFFFARSYLPERQTFRSYRGKLVLICVSNRFVQWFEPTSDSYRTTPFIIDYAQRTARANNKSQGKFMGIEWAGVDFKSELPCVVMISYWYLAVPLAGVVAWLAITLRRHKAREMTGHCKGCGYDLRASQEKCPECGMAVSGDGAGLATSTAAAR